MTDATGGPVFPYEVRNVDATVYHGLTLRDYFAAKAREEDIQAHIWRGYTREQARYRYADAMLKARDAGK